MLTTSQKVERRPSIKAAIKRWLPGPILAAIRWFRTSFPYYYGDLAEDLRDLFRSPEERLPTPGLRQKVGLTPSRDEYVRAGEVAAAEILDAFEGARDSAQDYPRWLDFGCGAARIARHVVRFAACRSLTGVDVDLDSIAWSRNRYQHAEFLAIASEPPTPLPAKSFDVVYAASVFTHLDEGSQFRWLAELHRLLRPGGLLIASTHAAGLHTRRPEMSDAERDRLGKTGFGFVAGEGHFNTSAAFHSREYLEREWGRHFVMRSFKEQGLFRYQDLSVWSKESQRDR